MKKRAKICLYIFLVCTFCALGILGYFVFNPGNDNVMVGSRKFVTFSEVPGATTYSMSVKSLDKQDLNEYIAKYKVQKVATENNKYSFKIEVLSNDDIKIAQETYTQKITSQNEEENEIDCIILDYTVDFFNAQGEIIESRKFEDQTLKNVDKNIVCCVISEYFESLFIKDAKFQVTFTAYDESGNIINNSVNEFEYDYHAYYETDFIRRPNFYINGQWYDYVITNKKELEQLVWHTILYRENNVTFYIKTKEINGFNLNSLVVEAINNYPEYDALNDASFYSSIEENVGTLKNFTYYLSDNFTKNFTFLKSQDENAYNKVEKYIHKKDDSYKLDYIQESVSTNRNFEIDNDSVEQKDEVLVNNTEQLFMVVQYGDRPVFSEKATVAKQVYENAKLVLKKINNSDNLSDYEKALNIYRYLCNEVVYDYVLYQYMDYKNDFSIQNFGNFSSFYLEGVFYDLDNQYAVCDGLSKAYVLLCNIEGIDCVKINGTVDGGNHAWNKVYLEDYEYNVNNWYGVDITWGVATYSQVKNNEVLYYEIPTQTYFLALGDEEREVFFQAGINEQIYNYDYYSNTNYSFDLKINNFYIENDDELKEVFDYAEYILSLGEDNAVIEIKIDDEYQHVKNSLIFKFILLDNINASDFEMRAWFTQAGLSSFVSCNWFVLGDVILFKFA